MRISAGRGGYFLSARSLTFVHDLTYAQTFFSALVCVLLCSFAVQVNYTRKVQHFAAYLVPLLFTPSGDCNCKGTLEVQ